MIRRRRRTNVTNKAAPLGHEDALDAAEKLRDMTPAKRAKEWAKLKPRIVEHLRSTVGPSSASATRKEKRADRISDLYLRHAEGKTSFLPLRAPRAVKLDDYRESDE
jgi:hypothetical protein